MTYTFDHFGLLLLNRRLDQSIKVGDRIIISNLSGYTSKMVNRFLERNNFIFEINPLLAKGKSEFLIKGLKEEPAKTTFNPDPSFA